MAHIRTYRPSTCSGSSGGGEPVYAQIVIDEPYVSGTAIATIPAANLLTGDYNSIILWFQKNFAQPAGADWTYNAGTGELSLNFSFDPATDYPETGEVIIDYWYLQA